VKEGETTLSSGKTWDLPDLPDHVYVSGKEASDAFGDVQFHLEYSGHNITATDDLNMTVLEIVWMPLGEATALTRFKVGRVYVPTKYGGTLTLTGSGSKLYYRGDENPPDNYPGAIQIVKRELAPTQTGNPCTRTVPYDEFRWYYVAVDAQASITATFSQARTDLNVPWDCSFYPFSGASSPNLCATGGPLARYDQACGTTSVEVEKTYPNYMFKHYYPANHSGSPDRLLEVDAESTVGYDFNGSGQITADIAWDFWNAAWDYWVGYGGLIPPDQSTASSVDVSWWGHCDIASLVSIFEPEPPEADYTYNGVTFTQADKKGLLVALYHGYTGQLYGPDIAPNQWQRCVESGILHDGVPFVCDVKNTGEGTDEVWNHPVYAVQFMTYVRDGQTTDPQRVCVTCRVSYAGV